MSNRTDTFAPLSPDPAPGLREQLADALFARIPEMAEDLTARPSGGLHCMDFLRQLLAGKTPEEAATFMAYALAPRHSIWWGHECLQARADLLAADDRAMMALAAGWVAEPDEPHRYAALNAGQGAAARGPGVWLALAAGWSGGSMAPADLPVVEVPEFVLGRAVNAAVLTALARVPQDKRARMLEHYIGMGDVLAKSG